MASPADRLAHVRSLIGALNRHDVAGSVEHLSATATWNRGDGTSLRGRGHLAAHLKGLFAVFPDASLTPSHIQAIEPNAVVVEWVLEGTHLGSWQLPGHQEPTPPTGRAVRAAGADLFRFNHAGEIESDEARIDVATLASQIGPRSRPSPAPMELRVLAERYTIAWGSHDAARVAAYYSSNGSLSVNGGAPAIGRSAIAEVAQGFMTAFPDMTVIMDGLLGQRNRAVYRWTLVGSNTGPGGTGHRVRISGFEVWQTGSDGLIAESRGYFDSAAYQSQLERGAEEADS